MKEGEFKRNEEEQEELLLRFFIAFSRHQFNRLFERRWR